MDVFKVTIWDPHDIYNKCELTILAKNGTQARFLAEVRAKQAGLSGFNTTVRRATHEHEYKHARRSAYL